MAQLHLDATVTDGSASVLLSGDVRSQIKAGDYFKLVGRVGVYEIASSALAGSDTEITLTAPYVGDSGTYPALVHRDFTARGYPLIYAGDLDVPDILRRWALQMDGEVTHAEDAAGEAVAAHVAQTDPHPQYTLQSLLNLGKSTTSPATPITGSLLSGAMLAAGAIVEMGQNANGRYWRWESGLQVCTHTLTLQDALGNNILAGTWVYPAGFTVSPYVDHSLRQGGVADATPPLRQRFGRAKSALSSASVSLRAFATGDVDWAAGDVMTTDALAVGRWK